MHRVLIILALCTPLLHTPAAPAQSTRAKKAAPKLTTREKQIRSLLLESYDLGRELPTETRLTQLTALCAASTERVDFLSDYNNYIPETRDWSEEEFRIASELPNAQAMSDAAKAMSRFSSSRALQMLDAIPPPADRDDLDFRATAASTIFREMLQRKGPAALPLIRRTAAKIGDSGAYPYGAVMLVIVRMHHEHPEIAQQLFADALGYYERGRDDFAAEMQFIGMLQFVSSTASAPQPLLVEAAREITSHIFRMAEDSQTSDDPGVASVSFLARRAQNTFEKIDPALAKQLRERVAATSSEGNGARTHGEQPMTRDHLSPPRNFDSATSHPSAPEEALLDEVMSLSEDGKSRTTEMKQLIAKAFDTGARNLASDLQRENFDEHMAKRNAGGLELFVSYVAKFAPDYVIEEIHKIQDNEVKAFLLIEAARAMQDAGDVERRRSRQKKVKTSAPQR